MLKGFIYLIRYLLMGVSFIVSPYGWFYLGCGIGALLTKNAYCIRQWYALDVAIATAVYGTEYRTISGVVGEKAHKTKKYSWRLQERFINRLSAMVGDKPNHCYRAYLWEKEHVTGVK